ARGPRLGRRQAPRALVGAGGEVVGQPDLAEVLAVVEAHRASRGASSLQYPAMIDPATLLASARAELGRLPRVLDALLQDVDATTWRERPAVGEWSPLESRCHPGDEETEDFTARLRVVTERAASFAAIDPARWVEERAYRDADPQTALSAFRERRAATLAFLAALSPERLRHSVAHPRLGQLSGLDL